MNPVNREGFAALVEPYRRQLKAYCYRMSGSLHEAEDLVQETFLRAWRSIEGLEAPGALRAWLFQIATRVSLDGLARRKRRRRILPEAEFPAATDLPSGEPPGEITWVEPYPDAQLDDLPNDAPDPEVRYLRREAVRLAFVAAIQHLPPRQRAVLLLADVLGWSSGETATLIGGSVASVNSALQRARGTLGRLFPRNRQHDAAVVLTDHGALLDRYVRAWEEKNLDSFVALLKEEASYAMPPWGHWYLGREPIRRFFEGIWPRYDRFRLFQTAANGGPAFALYTFDKTCDLWRAHSLHVLHIEDGQIAECTFFVPPLGITLFPGFGFQTELQP